MKTCRHCGSSIPDHAKHCPNCRGAHPSTGWAFQAFLVLIVTAAAVAMLLL